MRLIIAYIFLLLVIWLSSAGLDAGLVWCGPIVAAAVLNLCTPLIVWAMVD